MHEIEIITGVLLKVYNIDISKYDDTFLIKTIDKRVSTAGSVSVSEYRDYLGENRAEADLFLDSLHITFSEFFRNPITFAYLEQIVLPLLVEKKKKSGEREIRVWSAACAAGQEAYSIAIILDEIIENSNSGVKCRIFATDNNQDELEVAAKGNYTAASLGRVTLKRINTCFSQVNGIYKVLPRIREYIDFSEFDLLTEAGACPPVSIFGSFDLVFCSNLLFYYKQEYRKVIIEKTGNSISPGGYLITGESERGIVEKYRYREIFSASAIFQHNSF